MTLMDDRSNARRPRLRARRLWVGGGALVAVLLIAAALIVPRVVQNDPCDIALPFASELGLQLSDDDEVVSCEWQTGFTDSGGIIIVRTSSPATRKALLKRSGVSEETAGRSVSINDGPFRSERWLPNRGRSEQVYLSIADNGHVLKISYDAGVDHGLLLTVGVSQT